MKILIIVTVIIWMLTLLTKLILKVNLSNLPEATKFMIQLAKAKDSTNWIYMYPAATQIILAIYAILLILAIILTCISIIVALIVLL